VPIILKKNILGKDDILDINIIYRLLINIIRRVYSLGINSIYLNTDYLRILIIDRLLIKKIKY
jgi:hypothetical protein